MATSESGPSTSTSFKDSNVAINNSGPGSVTTGPVNFNINNSASVSEVYEFPLPRLIDTFHGRDREMRALDEAFFTQQKNKVVICGLGGFGKSELSKQFGHQCQVSEKVECVLWIRAEDSNELQKSYINLSLIYKECADKQLLMIFDNCVNQQDIINYEPRGNQKHRVLITSQYKQWKSDVKIIELGSLSSTSAMKVFRSVLGNKYSDEDERLYIRLARSVGCIPLGLQVVASYVEQGGKNFNLTDYVHEIEKSEHRIIDEKILDCATNSYTKSIYGAMITSIHKIKNKPDQKPQVRKLAHDVLCFSAYLNPDYILTTELLSLVNVKNIERKDNEFKLALKLLLNYSFFRYDEFDDNIVQHRTTQAFVRYYIRKSKLQCKFYTVCLQWALLNEDRSSILSYADSNVKVVHKFYKVNNMHKNISCFLTRLIEFECIECMKTIFKNPDEQTKMHIYQFDLVAKCAPIKHLNILKVLLPHVNIHTNNLDLFARCKNLEGIKMLTEKGAKMNFCNAAGDPLLFTFIHGNELHERHDWDEVFKTLQPKTDFSVTNSNNQTLLHAAATGQQPALIDFLIKNGLQVNQTDNNGWTPLDSLYAQISNSFDYYIGIDNYVPILEKLLKLEATSTSNMKHTTERGDSCGFLLLNYALKRNNLELLELLLNSGVDVNSRNRNYRTVLHRCVIVKNLNATQIVIKHNADCYVRDHDGDTPLIRFVKNVCIDNDEDYFKNMLDLLQCHPGHVDAAGDTLLHVYVKKFKLKLVEMLIKHYKFDVNVQNSNGDTPLHAVISSLNDSFHYDMYKEEIIQTIKMLNSYNARLDLKNNTEETPLDMLQKICTEEDSYIINDLSPYLTPAPSSVNNRKR